MAFFFGSIINVIENKGSGRMSEKRIVIAVTSSGVGKTTLTKS